MLSGRDDAQEEGTEQLRKQKDSEKDHSVPGKEGRQASSESDTDKGEVIIEVEYIAPGQAELDDHEAEQDQVEAPGVPPLVLRSTRIQRPLDRF